MSPSAQPGEDLVAQVAERLAGLHMAPVVPAHLGGEARRVIAFAEFGLLLAAGLVLVQLFEKEQVTKLFNGVERVGQPARPELVPQLVHLRTEFGVGEHRE